jgi:hypothetical protein
MTNDSNLQPLTALIELARFSESTTFSLLALLAMLEMRDRHPA